MSVPVVIVEARLRLVVDMLGVASHLAQLVSDPVPDEYDRLAEQSEIASWVVRIVDIARRHTSDALAALVSTESGER